MRLSYQFARSVNFILLPWCFLVILLVLGFVFRVTFFSSSGLCQILCHVFVENLLSVFLEEVLPYYPHCLCIPAFLDQLSGRVKSYQKDQHRLYH